MKIRSKVTVCALALFLLAGCEKKTDPSNTFLTAYAQQVAAPAYDRLRAAADNLNTITSTCASSNLDAFLPAAQSEWRTTMTAWQEAKVIRFGPVSDQRLDWEFQFWPDKKNLVAKKTMAFMKQQEPLTEEQLAQSSVVLHGLSAMELLLFDPAIATAAAPGRFCEMTEWVGKSIAEHAKILDSSWALLQPEFIAPGEESEQFASSDVAIAKVLDSYLVTLEELSKQKIGEVIGEDDKARTNAYFLESWRSQNSWQNIAANIKAIDALFNQGGFITYLNELGFTELSQQLKAKLAALDSAAARIKPPLFTSLDEQKTALRAVQTAALDLRSLFKNDITQVLNLPVGFNDKDGD